jgi:hypothetical protein
MRVHPFLAAASMLLAGVMAFAATSVVQHGKARARRPPPPPDPDEALPAARQVRPMIEAPRIRAAAPPAPPARAELHVHVTGPHGIDVEDVDVSLHRRGDQPDAWDVLDTDDDPDDASTRGRFSSSDLALGRYDLRVEAPGMRTVRLEDVQTGPRVVEVALARAPALLGSVGDGLRGEGCGGVTVTWSAGEESGDAPVDEADCTFAIETLPDAGPVTVVAARGTATARALVTPPLSGDPAVVCLAPPCDAEPASLLVYVADTNHQQIDDATLEWTYRGGGLRGAMGRSMGAGLLFVHGRHAGETLALYVERGHDETQSTVVLGPGVTEVVLTLPAAPPAQEEDRDDEPEEPIRERIIIRR